MSSTNSSANINSILEYIATQLFSTLYFIHLNPVRQVQFCSSTIHHSNNNDLFVYIIKHRPTLRKWLQKLCDIKDIYIVL
jgi:hypothetical protein